MRTIRVALAVFSLLILAQAAQAQYVWIDASGTRQYSDIPPPADVPASRILKQPGTALRVLKPDSTENAKAPTTANDKRPMSLAEKNVEYNKRRLEQAEQEKKAAEEARYAKEKAKSCERASAYQRALESGIRIARTDVNGETTYLDDEQRAREMHDTQQALADCKS